MKHRCEKAAAEPEWAGALPVGEHDRGRPVAVALGTDNRPVPCGRRAPCTRTPLGAWLRLAGAELRLDPPPPPWGVAKAGRSGASGARPRAPLRLRGLPAPSQRKDP